MHKLGDEEWLVCIGSHVCAHSKCFEIKAGMHLGSALRPLLLVIVMEAISKEFRVALTWEL